MTDIKSSFKNEEDNSLHSESNFWDEVRPPSNSKSLLPSKHSISSAEIYPSEKI